MTLTLSDTLALLFAMTLLAALPSISVLAVTSRTVAAGVAAGVAVALGVVAGDVIFILAAMLGLVALADSFGAWFTVARVIGGLYLVWLGLALWRASPLRATGSPAPATAEDGVSNGMPRTADAAALPQAPGGRLVSGFIGGLLLTLGDQKAILFYLGFLPAFLDLQHVTAADIWTVVLVAVVAVGGTKFFYIGLISRTRHLPSLPYASVITVIAAIMLALAGATVVVDALRPTD